LGTIALAALAAAPALALADAPATQPTVAELQEQLRQLQSKIEQLEAKQSQVDSKVVTDTVERVLRDSEKRSQVLQMEGFTAGYSNGKFIIGSADGNFLLHPWLQFQFRNTTNFRENVTASGDDDWQNGFEVRRMKLGFDGNVFSKDLTYLFLWATDRKSGNLVLEEAFARYQFPDSDTAVRGGQFKDFFAHESQMSSKKLMAADRTLLTDNFTGGDNFVQGVAFEYAPKSAFHAAVAVHDGARNNFNQNFQDFPTNNADWGAAGRVEWLASGNWKDYEDFTAMGTKDDNLLVFGVAADYTEAGDTGILLHTADAQFETDGGLSIYGAFYGRYTKDAPVSALAVATTDLYDWGAIVQAAYLFDNWEPFVRYDYISFDSDGLPAGTEDQVHEITAGVNYYVHGHAAKFTLDAGWLPNGSPVADDGAGILVSEDNQFYFRAQFQLLL
jgi:hypothetical protein